jgi:hypothetical protein
MSTRKIILIALASIAALGGAWIMHAGTSNPNRLKTYSTADAVKKAPWGDNLTLTFGTGIVNIKSNGLPNHEHIPDKFLIPKNPNDQPFKKKSAENFNIVDAKDYLKETPINDTLTTLPTFVETPTDTGLGQIGIIVSGARLFNDYENIERSVVALDDNVFHDHAAFVDQCNGHPLVSGESYHYHGVPKCITEKLDVAGQHSTMIGLMADGFPIYGDKGAGGVEMKNADLDQCSGHTEPTKEFPDGIYHYHLTSDKAPYSVDCYHGHGPRQ